VRGGGVENEALAVTCRDSADVNASKYLWVLELGESLRHFRRRSFSDQIAMIRLFAFPIFCVASWVSPVARAGNDPLYMVGLEIHASKSLTPAEAEKISRYLFHNITKWSPGAAMIVYERDTRGGGSKVDLNVVVYISKLGKAYSLFVENTDEVALRKELMEKGVSKSDVDTLVGNPESPVSRTSGTNWGTVPESNLFESLDGII
jgi:hypothetical protein